MRVSEAATFAQVRVRDFGSVEWLDRPPSTVDDVVAVWTRCQGADDPFATVEVRGVVGADGRLIWLPDDAVVEMVAPPRYADDPARLLAAPAVKVSAPAGSRGVMKTSEGWPPLIWESDMLHSAVQGWTDAEIAVSVLLCALHVAPETGMLRPMLIAGLRARYAKMLKHPDVYEPARFPWRDGLAVDASMLEYLAG